MVYQNTYLKICLSLLGCKENILCKEHILHHPVIAWFKLKFETHLCIVEEPVVVLPALEIAHSHLFTARHLNNNNFSTFFSNMITSSDYWTGPWEVFRQEGFCPTSGSLWPLYWPSGFCLHKSKLVGLYHVNKHCQRHYGPRCWLLWPVILVW